MQEASANSLLIYSSQEEIFNQEMKEHAHEYIRSPKLSYPEKLPVDSRF